VDTVIFILEAIVVLGAIVMGTRSSGVGLGLWGGLGVAVLVFVFGEAPGSPPTDAVFIILAVVLTASTMEAAGGIDWMVSVAAKLIRRAPKQISVIAPLVAWLFSMGAGTANILYPLLPVIYDVSYANKVRPERPLSMAVIGVGLGVICSPVSAAMAAMITLTDVPPYNLDLADVMLIVVPACFVGIVAGGLFSARRGVELLESCSRRARRSRPQESSAQRRRAATRRPSSSWVSPSSCCWVCSPTSVRRSVRARRSARCR
jgi:anaerobic C4-dicarboxylate transporter DcuA/anaerobic C4-dicarboxylate transporter DcuB